MASTLQETERQRSEFIADVSHELRTPLSTLQGYMEGLIDGVIEPSDDTWGLLYTEPSACAGCGGPTTTLSGRSRPAHPRPGARIAGGDHQSLHRKHAPTLRRERSNAREQSPRDVPHVVADTDRVVQVLTNLLRNALRYTPAEGRVVVEAGVSGDEVRFTVRDTGAGIDARHLPHVFERFYRAEKSRSRRAAAPGWGSRSPGRSSRRWAEGYGLRVKVRVKGLPSASPCPRELDRNLISDQRQLNPGFLHSVA